MKKVFFVALFVAFSIGFSLDCSCNSCEDCTNKTQICDVVHLSNDVFYNGNSQCIKINRSVTVDCNGHQIVGAGNGYAFYINNYNKKVENVTIKNCKIYNFNYGIYAMNAKNINIYNSELNGNNFGLYLQNSENINIYNNKFNGGTGITLNNVMHSKIEENIFKGCSQAINAIRSLFTNILNNEFYNNGQVLVITTNSDFSEFKNNYVTKTKNNVITATNIKKFSVVQNTFEKNSGNVIGVSNSEIDIESNKFNNNFGNDIQVTSSKIKVFSNEFNGGVKGNALFGSDLEGEINYNKIINYNIGIIISNSKNDLHIDENDINNTKVGMQLNSVFYAKVEDNKVFNSDEGLKIINSNYLNISNNIVSVIKKTALFISNSFKNNIYHNIFNSTTIIQTSKENRIYDNMFYGNISLINCGKNQWYIEKTEGTNIVGYNFVAGNVYLNSNRTGFSQTCTDKDNDLICDSEYHLDKNNIDKYPIVYDNHIKTVANNTTTSTDLEEFESNSSPNYLLYLVICLIIIAIFAGGYYYYKKKKFEKEDQAIKDDEEIKKEYEQNEEEPKEDEMDEMDQSK